MLYQQDYQSIKRYLLRTGQKFEDPHFLPNDASLFFSRAPPRAFVWKRPHEICDNPSFLVGGASRHDIDQGYLGNCWFLAALSSLSLQPTLLKKVIGEPSEHNFNEDYAGIFRFNFWQYGEWIEVVIDDRLPTYNDKLVFAHSSENNEFWSALVEKAYAKLHGSYEALKGGETLEAMEDFTGGISEYIQLKSKTPINAFSTAQKAFLQGSLLSCHISYLSNLEEKQPNGLVKGQAYAITATTTVHSEVRGRRFEVQLLRLRNPWGNEREWNGAWSDRSEEWNYLTDSEKQSLGLVFEDDGEFWMSFDDWKDEFDQLAMCHLEPTSSSTNGDHAWNARTEKGKWVRGSTAGGCRNFPDTFHKNPQFRVTLENVDDSEGSDSKCSLLIGLMQKDRRKLKERGVQNLTIGFAIYECTEHRKLIDVNELDACGTTFFLVKEKMKGKDELVPRLLGINKESVVRVDEKKKEILKTWPLTSVRQWVASPTSFSLDFGDFSEGYYSVQTTESEAIGQLIAGYIDIILKGDAAKNKLLNKDFFLNHASTARSATFFNAREIVGRFELSPGIYCIVPSTFEPNQEGDFILRIYSEKPVSTEEIDEEVKVLPYKRLEPTPEEDQKINSAFKARFDQLSGYDDLVDVFELQQLFTAAFKQEMDNVEFGSETCRTILTYHGDKDVGKLTFEQFKEMMLCVKNYRIAFYKFDKDKSLSMDSYELREALHHVAGIAVSNALLAAISLRFKNQTNTISFDDFLGIVYKIKLLCETFSANSEDGRLTMNLDSYLTSTIRV